MSVRIIIKKEWQGEGPRAQKQSEKEPSFFFVCLFSCKCCVDFHMQRKGFVTWQILMYLINAAFRFGL